MSAQDMASTSMYCRQCGYALMGLSEMRCPECGLGFDPTNSKTYFSGIRTWRMYQSIRRICWAMVASLLCLGLLFVALWGHLRWHYYPEWQAEQPVITTIAAMGGRVHIRPNSPFLLSVPLRWLGWDYVFGRAQFIMLERRPPWNTGQISAEDMQRMGALKHLELFQVIGYHIDPSGLKYLENSKTLTHLVLPGSVPDAKVNSEIGCLKGLTNLVALNLMSTDVGDDALQYLQGMTRMQYFILSQTHVSDAGLVHLRGMIQMRQLGLDDTDVTDAGLANLKNMTFLEELHLKNTQVSDSGLAYLQGLKCLRVLDVSGTRVTRQGISQLKQILPAVVVTGGL